VVRLWSMTGINRLVQAQGQQLLRMKGVLNLHDESRRLYFHSVHMLLDTTFGKAWQRDEARENRLVMIGRHLDADQMREGAARLSRFSTFKSVAC
jgi:G3E family GTPase